MILHLVADSFWREKPSAAEGQVFYGILRGEDLTVSGPVVSEGEYSEFIQGEHGWLGIRIDGSVYGELHD